MRRYSLAHTYKTVVGRHHQETVVGLATKKAKYRGPEISLVARQICKADDFGLLSLGRNSTLLLFEQLTDRFPISSHDSFLPGTSEEMTSPLLSKPIISIPTELVLPLSISCLCRKRFTLALPRPSSSPPLTSTPSMVLLPASTMERSAPMLRHVGFEQIKLTIPHDGNPSLNDIVHTRRSPPQNDLARTSFLLLRRCGSIILGLLRSSDPFRYE